MKWPTYIFDNLASLAWSKQVLLDIVSINGVAWCTVDCCHFTMVRKYDIGVEQILALLAWLALNESGVYGVSLLLIIFVFPLQFKKKNFCLW